MLSVKDQFPIFSNNSDLVYLDTAATSLKPKRVIDKVVEYYSEYSANINRGIYKLSERSTEEYEKARVAVGRLIGIENPNEVVFVRNATEAINLVAYSWGRKNLKRGDEIALTRTEHHANLVPWQELAKEVGAGLNFLDIDEEGKLKMGDIEKWLTDKTKLVALTQASNVLGTINEVGMIVSLVRKLVPGVIVLVDGAQAVPQMPVSILELDCDFYAFSGHKMYGPTGVGVLWGRENLLNQMQPFLYGGDMIEEVRFEGSTFKTTPVRFEAGTPHIAGVIGLGEAAKFLMELGMDKVRAHEREITEYALSKINEVEGIHVVGPKRAEDRGGLVSFTVDGIHPHDLAQILDERNVAIRSGHHCAMPLHARLGLSATSRASFGVYTTKEDIEKLIKGIGFAKERLA